MAKLERAFTAVLVVAAVVIAVANVYRVAVASPGRNGPRAKTQSVALFKEWQDVLREGIVLDSNSAPVTIAYFGDLECPACARFHESVERVTTDRLGQVNSVFVHFPLPGHRFAAPGAIAAECAAAEKQFPAFVASVYAKQDSLGLRSWLAYALDAGVQDTARFSRCVANTRNVPRISNGIALGERVGVRGTPTVIINGWRFEIPPDVKTLSEVVDRLIANREPF